MHWQLLFAGVGIGVFATLSVLGLIDLLISENIIGKSKRD